LAVDTPATSCAALRWFEIRMSIVDDDYDWGVALAGSQRSRELRCRQDRTCAHVARSLAFDA
jgi:hypothetical protein